jgi:hypothetical protein
MIFPDDEIEEQAKLFPGTQRFEERGKPYFLLPNMRLPEGCEPQVADGLFCQVDRGEGYPSRLFFSSQVKSKNSRNWNTMNARIIERNWFAFSWRIGDQKLRLAQMVAAHMKALQ